METEVQKFYFKIENSLPVGDPILQSDLKKIFVEHDFELNAPTGFAEYLPSLVPRQLGIFEKLIINGYKWENGKIVDEILISEMTQEEKDAKIILIKENFYKQTGRFSWRYNEQTNLFEAPFRPKMPLSGGIYDWDETAGDWFLVGRREWAMQIRGPAKVDPLI